MPLSYQGHLLVMIARQLALIRSSPARITALCCIPSTSISKVFFRHRCPQNVPSSSLSSCVTYEDLLEISARIVTFIGKKYLLLYSCIVELVVASIFIYSIQHLTLTWQPLLEHECGFVPANSNARPFLLFDRGVSMSLFHAK